ncbi:short-chain dehydrogenase [Agreia sp. Leaf244]|uniref:SDR family oxidoreductase n=1 Tax=Agreia sp. Leaf244 TaxID=1736305 RepID=UPI0006FC63F3|nr:SDR family oxidoreductase [Agreia sp. Leaf244]KQO05424.1 short-chain dehydrogenase [Agreia sp. Leaf244]
MNIEGSIALVTGANRGLGRSFAEGLLDRGASKVYAAARNIADIDIPGVEALELDVTNPDQVRAAAERAGDVTLLVNNAGNNTWQNLVDGDLGLIRSELDTHFYGTLNMVRAFAPILGRNNGGAIVNMLSAMSWFAYPGDNAYHVAKAAEWALTNSVRIELQSQGTVVTGVHLGLADTDMTSGFDGEKLAPADVVSAVLDGVETKTWEVLLDQWTRSVKSSLAGDPASFYSAQV